MEVVVKVEVAVEVRSKVKANAIIAASLAIKPKIAESRRSSRPRNLEVEVEKPLEAKLKPENGTNVRRQGISQKIAKARR